MPSPSPTANRRNTMQRQLSLQGTAPPVATVHRGLRRQLSEDASDNGFLNLRIGNGKKPDKHQVPDKSMMVKSGGRPKPLRIAWGDRKQDIADSAPGEGVEVVARRCAGLPRPTSRISRAPNLPLVDKDVLALSREQLAERLRRAWKTRERKPNLDIFLAHSMLENTASARSTVSEDTDSVMNPALKPFRAIHQPAESIVPECANPGKVLEERNKIEINLGIEDQEDKNISPFSEPLDFKMFPVGEPEEKLENNFASRQFQIRSMSFTKQYSFNKENIEESSPPTPVDTNRRLSASERRASFKSSQLLNRTISGSFSDGTDDSDKGIKIILTKTQSRPPLVRTSSAPNQKSSRPSSSTPQPTIAKSLKTSPSMSKKINPPITHMDVGQDEDIQESRSMARRKLKTVAVRRKPKERSESSDDEEKCEINTKKPPRRRQLPRGSVGSDIITMVSLVSPAESEVEEPPPIPVPATSGEQTENEEAKKEIKENPPKEVQSHFVLQKCIALRKAAKTVSFQAHPPVSRSCSASFPLRRAPPGAPIIIPTPTASPLVLTQQLHNKFPEEDSRGVKRRLIRSRTTLNKEDEENASSDDTSRTDTSTEAVVDQKRPSVPEVVNGLDISQEADDGEPEFKSPKEKECWVLYKRMVEKGVSVSYETVLRGMLTPTEYRLRKNQLSRF